MHTLDIELSLVEQAVCIHNACLAQSDRFYLSACELDPGNILFEELIIVRRLLVLNNYITCSPFH